MSDENDMDLEEQIIRKAEKNRRIARHMANMGDIVEDKIRQAMAEGKFDNLEGSGKPIVFDENPYIPDEMRMAFKILKDNNFAPYWVELGKEIDDDLEKLDRQLENFLVYCQVFWSSKQSATTIQFFERKKERFYQEQWRYLNVINRKIVDYNLQCPTFRLGRAGLNIEAEKNKMLDAVETAIAELQKHYRK